MVVVDARGLRCPLPLRLVLREVARQSAAQQGAAAATFEVLADDPAFDLDLRAWAAVANYRVEPMGTGPLQYRVTGPQDS